MSELDASERAFLRLGSGDSAGVTLTVELPATGAMLGLSSGAGAVALDEASFVDVGLGPGIPANLVHVRRVSGAGHLAVVEAGEARLAFTGKARPFHVAAPEGMELEPAWLVGEEAGRVIAHVLGDGVELAVCFDEGRVSVLRLDRQAADAALTIPLLDTLVARDACEPWLHEEVERLVASTALDERVIGLGLVARLWTPPRGQAVAFLGREEPAPSRAIEVWARAIPLASLDVLERASAPRLRALRGALRELEEAVAESPEGATARDLLRAIVRGRDELESLLLVLRASGRGAVLGARLAQLDGDARSRMTTLGLAAVAVADDPRVAAVGWQEPDAWWGTLAE